MVDLFKLKRAHLGTLHNLNPVHTRAKGRYVLMRPHMRSASIGRG